MMDITLNAVAYRGGVPVQTELNLTRRSDGTWHATNFGDVLQGTYNAGKSGTPQSPNCGTREAGTAARTKLSDQEIAKLAGKYNPHNMTQSQYDAFLDDLIEKGALSRFDAMRLGHHGWRILDINPDTFASGGTGCGSAYAASAEDSGKALIQSLEDADGDLVRWLERMLARQDQGTHEGSRQKKESLEILSDIVRRMQTA